MFSALSLVLILVSSMVSLEIKFVRVFSLSWVDSHALIKYLNNGGNITSI